MKTKFDMIDEGKLIDILRLPISDNSKIHLLDTTSVTVSITANRLQSLFICEQRYSYSIQSQRYCRFDAALNDSTILNGIENYIGTDKQKELDVLLAEIQDLYLEMTKVKAGHENVTKKTLADFEYGIPVEDARSILPMVFYANHIITMTGLEFMKLLNMMYHNDILFRDLECQIDKYIHSKTDRDMDIFSFVVKNRDKLSFVESVITEEEYKIRTELLGDNIDHSSVVNILDYPKVPLLRKSGLGALTCTNMSHPVDINNSKTDEQMKRVTERVTFETGHTSVSENCNINWCMRMSVAAYNQYVRHRHQKCYRVDFGTSKYIMPKTIEDSIFKDRVFEVMDRLFDFIEEIKTDQPRDINLELLINQLYPMGYELKVLVNSNLINEFHIGEKRNCNKAQNEIHHISLEKYKLLSKVVGSDKLMSMAQPSCMNGKCSEGKNTCGNNTNIKIFFGKGDK